MMILKLMVFLNTLFWTTHPFHTSITDCKYNTESKNLEITVRVFTDDMELAIGQVLPPSKPSTSTVQDSALIEYLQRNFGFKAGGVQLKPIYLGRETEYDITYLYLEITSFPLKEPYQVKQSLLFDQFEDQSNIVHLTVNGQSASAFFSGSETYKNLNF